MGKEWVKNGYKYGHKSGQGKSINLEENLKKVLKGYKTRNKEGGK